MYRTAPKEARARVDKATAKLTKTRCLITNIECDKMVDYCHVMRCAVENNEDELNKLEYSWDIGWYSLHIHTRRNIFRLSAKFHRLFDTDKWLLLPEPHIIEKFHEGIDTEMFPKIKDKTYKYKFIAHPDMKKVPIHRWDGNLPVSASSFKKFIYPFEDFPLIVSHVHPRFVIYDAACKLVFPKVSEFAQESSGNLRQMLIMVREIYDAWLDAKIHPSFFQVKVASPAQPANVRPDREVDYNESSPSPPSSVSRRRRPGPTSQFGPQETPDNRATASYMPEEAKRRVDRFVPKRCLIERTNEANALEYVHVLARATQPTTLTNLEYAWGMRYNSLNVNTHRNVFRLSKNLHRLFDGKAWLLLPERHIINRYYEVKDEPGKFPVLTKKKYRYTLIANDWMKNFPIHVQHNTSSVHDDDTDSRDTEEDIADEEFSDDNEEAIENDGSSADPIDFNLEDAFTAFTFPYRGLPTIVSHIHPRFAIYNAGLKMLSGAIGTRFISDDNEQYVESLTKVYEIYDAWATTRSKEDFDVVGRPQQDKPEGGYPDDKTEPERLPEIPPPVPKRAAPQGDSPKSGKRPKSGGGQDSAWLDDETLGELDSNRLPQKAWHDKIAWIQSWVGQVPLDGTVEEVPMCTDLADKLTCHTPGQYPADSEDMDSLLSA